MNNYQYGSINGHNIVIACMPPGMPGNVSATHLATHLRRNFPNVKTHLFVGVGGGIPSLYSEGSPRATEKDVFLGDVVVGCPENPEIPAVITHDLRTTQTPDRGIVAKLGTVLRNYEQGNTRFDEHLRRLDRLTGFGHPGRRNDLLYESDFGCSSSEDYTNAHSLCDCDNGRLEKRAQRKAPGTSFSFHLGTILSANRFVSNAKERDEKRKQYPTALCFEMEAAGVSDTHALVIRGISDYADSHSNRRWQKYAAGAAAAFARELIVTMAEMELPDESRIDATNEKSRCFTFNSISMNNNYFLNKSNKDLWEQMTVGGLSIYEIIYLECVDESRTVTKEKLQQRFPNYLQECVSTTWDMISRGQERLYKGMTLAVIYINEEEGKKRRYILRRFGVWANCNCGDSFCPCLWNFANNTGLCRNPVDTCAVYQFVQTMAPQSEDGKMEISTSYELDKFLALRRMWESTEGDPTGEETTSVEIFKESASTHPPPPYRY
ncbi:Kinesin light chain [Lasiodiplodia theobromae]|uniref:Kinesin light chain n=1 Tax=Lasiodiplodia theobromae TaxID=45133 RepID=UPI0015C33D18|nr:Kinesin light chain [Lasiodiplodia theobromae]KAF4535885.1 Kinesin light chain [Lasiodiplodia theobromae]